MVSSQVIFIPKGGTNEIIAYLHQNNFDLSRIDGLIIGLFGRPQSGWLDVGSKQLTKGDFLYKLTNAKAALEEVMLIPGETLYFFIQALSTQLNLNPKKLYEAYSEYAPYEDGVILANTYKIPKGISEEHLMYYLVNTSLKEHQKWAVKFLGEYDQKQWFKYVTIASIIQKESANLKEMPLISAVIHNRLKKRMRLQMDGALNYGQYSHTKITPQIIKTDTSSYNTYKHDGIPNAPVSSVAFDAIRAAIFPANVDYLYFVRNQKGEHSFSKTYQEHRQNFQQ